MPILKFFHSKSASQSEFVKILTHSPKILRRDLQGDIVPPFNFIRDFLGSERMAVTAITHFSGILLVNPHTLEANTKAISD